MEANPVQWARIDTGGPRPVVRGTDIKVSQIAAEYEHAGMTPDEIIEAHPHLGLSDVHAALAFFYDHRTLIEQEWHEERTLHQNLLRHYPRRRGHLHG
jgi:uncharacterized protein (DUF433 family)